MKSLAVWFEPKSGDTAHYEPELHLHFNHWKLKKPKGTDNDKYEYLLDIGLKVIKGKSIEKICFFLPQEIENITKIIEDLGKTLVEQKLLTAVFNEKYDPRPVDTKKYIEVKKKDSTEFYIYGLDVEHDLVPIKNFGGTIVKFNFHFIDSYDTYYRIRLKTDFVKQFSHIYRPRSSYLESIFSSIELIDFRINDTRNLNLSLLEHISSNGRMFNISLIHLFVMRNLNDEYILSDLKLNNVRQLEEETWGTYLGSNKGVAKYVYEKMIAYHLKTKISSQDRENGKFIEDFSALLKFKFEDRLLKRYFLYIILFSLFTGILGNALYELIKYILDNSRSIISIVKPVPHLIFNSLFSISK